MHEKGESHEVKMKKKIEHAMKFFNCNNEEVLKKQLIVARGNLGYFDVHKADEIYDKEQERYKPNEHLIKLVIYSEYSEVISFLDERIHPTRIKF